MSEKDKTEIALLKEWLEQEFKEVKGSIARLDRAVYGDPDNLHQGLIDYNKNTQMQIQKSDASFKYEIKKLKEDVETDIIDINEKVSTLEKFKTRLVGVASGFGITAGLVGSTFWEWLTRLR